MNAKSKTFAANMETVPAMMEYVEGLLSGFETKAAYELTLACEEILVNIASYAYPEGDGQLAIIWEDDAANRTVRISFEDSGIPFNPLLREEPDLTVPVAERKIGGLGVMMIRKLMDAVQYNCVDGKNTLLVTKRY